MHCPPFRLSLCAASLLAALALCLPAPAQAATLTVPAQYPTIGAAVTAAASGDTVLVADGTYSGPGNRDINIGGKSLTITSQHGAASTVIDCGGSPTANHNGFGMGTGSPLSVVISGLTIENGYRGDGTNAGSGGAITEYGATLTVQNCMIKGNTAEGYSGGGGIFGNGGALTVTGCTFSGNAAVDKSNNGSGGGIYSGGMATVTSCTFVGNSAGDGGGGIYNSVSSNAPITVTNCLFTGNTANTGGGVFNVTRTNGYLITVTNCTLTGNAAKSGAGGGIYNFITFGGTGGISHLPNGNSTANNGPITLTNDIVYGDTGGEIANDASSISNATATSCDVQGGYSGTGNIDADPRFVYPPTDLHLRPGSPCLGAGTSTGAPTTDKDGNTRPNPPSIGAYEIAPAGTTHVLWDNSNGRMSLWNYSTASGTFSHQEYGPYSGYTAQAIADGPDGRTRILWDRSDGVMSMWSLDNAAGAFSHYEFGPYSGYTAIGVSAGY